MKGEGIENHSSNNDEPIFFWRHRWLCVAAAINPSSMAQKIYHYRLPQTIVNRYIWVQTLFTSLLIIHVVPSVYSTSTVFGQPYL